MSLFLKAVFVFVGFMLLAHATPVFAQGGGPAGIPLIEYMFARVVCVAVPLGYTALLVVLVFAGFKYLTSGGEAKAVQQAHQTVTWGLMGILFLAIAWLILLLIQNFTGVEVTKFSVSSLPGVQGFSGQCFGPAPIAPEPAKPTAVSRSIPSPSPSPIIPRSSQPIPTIGPPFDTCATSWYPFIERSYEHQPMPVEIRVEVRQCMTNIVCTNSAELLEQIPEEDINFEVYRGNVSELLNVFTEPRYIHIASGALDNTLYTFSPRMIETALNWARENNRPPTFGNITIGMGGERESDLYRSGYVFSRYQRGETPQELINSVIEARRIAERLNSELSRTLPLIYISGIRCDDGDYYSTLTLSPLIYLYPQKEMPIHIKIFVPIISTRLTLGEDKSWTVIASPDGRLTTPDDKKHKLIPYEFLRNDFKRPTRGLIIEESKLEQYLKENLWVKLGLTSSEIADYWQDTKPRIKPSPYYFVSLIDRSEIDRVLPMEVNPKPDTIIRNMTYILPLESQPNKTVIPLDENLLSAPERKGFTVLENGVFTDGF